MVKAISGIKGDGAVESDGKKVGIGNQEMESRRVTRSDVKTISSREKPPKRGQSYI